MNHGTGTTPRPVLCQCAVCGEVVWRLVDGRPAVHVPQDPQFSIDGQRGYYCRGTTELSNPLGTAIETQVIVTWAEHTEEAHALAMTRGLASELSSQGAVERVRVITRSRDRG